MNGWFGGAHGFTRTGVGLGAHVPLGPPWVQARAALAEPHPGAQPARPSDLVIGLAEPTVSRWLSLTHGRMNM